MRIRTLKKQSRFYLGLEGLGGLEEKKEGLACRGLIPAKLRRGRSICGAIKRSWPDMGRKQMTDAKRDWRCIGRKVSDRRGCGMRRIKELLYRNTTSPKGVARCHRRVWHDVGFGRRNEERVLPSLHHWRKASGKDEGVYNQTFPIVWVTVPGRSLFALGTRLRSLEVMTESENGRSQEDLT